MPARSPLRLPFALLLALAATALPAPAQESPPAGGGSQTAGAGGGSGGNLGTSIPDPGAIFGAGGPGAFFGVGIGQTDGDWYARAVINTDFSIGPVGLGLALPLSLLVYNNENAGCQETPCSRESKAFFGVLRRHDWDQPSDWLRFIRYVRYGHKREPLYVLVGQHWGSSIGHGTLVNRYNNTLNLDISKVGVALDVNTTYVGFETLTDNIMKPNLLAARAYVRPFGDTPILRGWAIGSTVAVDLNAPRQLLTAPSTTGGPDVLVLDSNGAPAIAWSQAQQAVGVDTEYALLDNSLIRLIPYVDANRIAGAGNGLHMGAMTTIRPPIPLLDVVLDARLEYRIMQAGYIPEYFDQTYDLGRVQYAMTGAGGTFYVPKAQAARILTNTPGTGTQGYYGELAFNLGGFIQVGGTLQDYQTDNGASLGLYATVPKIDFIKVQGYYLRKNFSGLSNAFALDERSLLGGTLAYKIFGPVYIQANYQRTWVLDPNSTKVQASDSYSFGIATFLPFGGGSAGPPPENP